MCFSILFVNDHVPICLTHTYLALQHKLLGDTPGLKNLRSGGDTAFIFIRCMKHYINNTKHRALEVLFPFNAKKILLLL